MGPRSARDRGLATDLVVVSHACVRSVNQLVYEELAQRGWRVALVLPERWRDHYQPDGFRPIISDSLGPTARVRKVVLPGQPQRYLYMTNTFADLKRARARHVLIEEEPYSLSALQWGMSAVMAGVPFSFRACENIGRKLPSPARNWTSYLLRRATSVMGCGADTRAVMARWGAGERATVVPFAVPDWSAYGIKAKTGVFTVGFAGRLVTAKGVDDLVAAVQRMRNPVHLIFMGNGPERDRLGVQKDVVVQSHWEHSQMHLGYEQLDVLVVPSRTTPTWKEQFGRVIVEALYCGVPVVGSDSGEIPNLISQTRGGLIFPERNVTALAEALDKLADDPGLRRVLADQGREAARRRYSVKAVADTIEVLILQPTGTTSAGGLG